MPQYIERATLHPRGFNDSVVLPYGLRVAEVKAAMDDIYDLLYNVNQFLAQRGWDRLEDMLLAAAFSGMMSGLVVGGVSKQSATLTANKYHNGRPDLVPQGRYEGDSCHRGDEGIEVKASRTSSWQGHNAETGWIMICQYSADSLTLPAEDRSPSKIEMVLCANLVESDWSFSGRGEGSRRTPTASINASGVQKLRAGVIYRDPAYQPRRARGRSIQLIAEQGEE